MPHATAAGLVVNSSLTFDQIAEFGGLHILEVQPIADATAATKLTGRDPVRAGELTHEEIEKGQKDPEYRLQMFKAPEASDISFFHDGMPVILMPFFTIQNSWGRVNR